MTTHCVAEMLTGKIGPRTERHLQLYVLGAGDDMYVMTACMYACTRAW